MKKFVALLFLLSLFVSASFAENAVPGDVIVVLKNTSGARIQSAGGVQSLSAVQSFAESQKVEVLETFDALSEAGNNIFMVVHSENENERELLRRIKSRPDVAAASLNYVMTLNLPEVPNDTEYFRLWGMEAINAPKAWTYGTGSSDVYVAVVDSGVDYNHPDLKENFSHEYSRNFLGHAGSNYDPSAYYDERGHGTHVAGTIAGVGNNAQGVAGVNWRAKIISVRVLNENGSGAWADIIAAFNYISGLLTKNPSLNLAAINFSVGGYMIETPEQIIAANEPLWLALKVLSDTNRAVICAAAGNEDNEVGRPTPSTTAGWFKSCYPTIGSYLELDNMISVAAANNLLSKASFSNYSRKYVDIAAPGVDTFSTIPLTYSNDKRYAKLPTVYPYASFSGTSMASPHVAGSAALLRSIFPKATASQIKAALLGGANGDYLRDDEYGTSANGFLDLTGAINFMAGIMSNDEPPVISENTLTPGVVSQRYKAEFYASGTQPITWTIDGDLPEGINFSDGKFSGTPKESGSFPFVLTASNNYGSSSLVLTLDVSAQEAPILRRPSDSYKLPEAYVKSSYQIDIETVSGDWPMTWTLGSGDYPADFDAKIGNGMLFFTPTETGVFSFPVTVSNDSGTDSYTFTITVNESKAPEICEINKHSVTLGRPVNVLFDYSGGGFTNRAINVTAHGTKPLSWKVENLPQGVGYAIANDRVNPIAQTLSFTGRAEESGDFAFTVTVSNDWGVASVDLNIAVEDNAPVFANNIASSFNSLEKDTEFSFILPVEGSAPIAFTVSGELPAGTQMLYEDNTPIFYGKPTETGHYTFTLIAENSCGSNDVDFDFYVNEPSELIAQFLPDAVKGVSYDAQLNLRSDVSMSWIVVADASLNLEISQTGKITAFPTTTGQFSIFVAAQSPDVEALTASSYSLMVRALPAIKTSSLTSGKANTAYNATVLSADGTAPITWAISEGVLPKGLTLSQNGHLFGTPTESGSFIFTIRASNRAGHDDKTFTLKIASDGTEPTPIDPPYTPPTRSEDKKVTPTAKQGSSRGYSSLTVGEVSALNGEAIAAILPEISVNVSGLYTPANVDAFANVGLSSDVPAGSVLMWHPFTAAANFTAFNDAEESESSATFYDTEGNEITQVPENHVVNISAYLEAGKTYRPVISAVPAGSVSSSSGGCSSGVLALSLLAIIFRKRSR